MKIANTGEIPAAKIEAAKIKAVKKQAEIVKDFQTKAEIVFDAIYAENESLCSDNYDMYRVIGYAMEPRCGADYVCCEIDTEGEVALRFCNTHYDSCAKYVVRVPIELFAFDDPKDIREYWRGLKTKEYEDRKAEIRREEEKRKKRARDARKKAKAEEYEMYLKLKKKYETK